jgi:hypothetical protein
MNKESIIKNLSLILLLIMLSPFYSSSLAQDKEPFLGTWNGAISIMGQELEIIVRFFLNDKQEIQGTIDVPLQGAKDLPLSNIKIEGKKISFMINDPGAPGEPTFKGELDENGLKIAGTFTQSGIEGTFTLKKEKGA